MMELENNQVEQKPVSVLQGDGFGTSRILARESSVGQSSRIFYRAAEGVPFKWEMMPGTPKNPQEEDAIPPLSPPPLMQSLGLPLPNLNDHDDQYDQGPALKLSKIWSLKKMLKKSMNHDMLKKVDVLGKKRSKQQESSKSNLDSDGEFGASLKDSSFSSYSSFPRDSIDGPFCCSPWNVSAILDEGNTRIYYCRQHKTAYAVEEDGSFLSRILSSNDDHPFSGPLQNDLTSPATGIPFRWEMQPGTPKNIPKSEVIPPPSPPPAVQSSTLPWPIIHDEKPASKDSSTWTRALSWMKGSRKTKKTEKLNREISFRYRGMDGMEVCSSDEEEVDASFRETGSVSSLSSVSPLSKGKGWGMSKIKRSFNGSTFLSCGPWSRRDILVLARKKFKSFGF